MKTLSIRVPETLFDDIERISNELGVTKSDVGREFLQRAVVEKGRSVVEEIDGLRSDLVTVFETILLSFTDATREQVRALMDQTLREMKGAS